jgi:hypothetical protein
VTYGVGKLISAPSRADAKTDAGEEFRPVELMLET